MLNPTSFTLRCDCFLPSITNRKFTVGIRNEAQNEVLTNLIYVISHFDNNNLK